MASTSTLLISWSMSLTFMFMNHPLSLGAILLLQTILITLATGLLYMDFWFSYILFLVMVGGMLVMFIYMTSVASNEKFSIPKHSTYYLLTSLSVLLAIWVSTDSLMNLIPSPEILSINQTLNLNNFNLSKFFNFPSMNILIAIMIYLLVTLIAVVKITHSLGGALRQM
uniref:NADH-ubiquinone oxidoreductase chain 6 n=1 Tax=Trigonopterus jasminae TaxID=2576128 RepID=A0A7H1KHV0_9CUCU|nr:NADH dehydrogenase subunit 6 [Trigonopterus jasminae]QNT26866.1 NADH dehydrogenase subunit 6 [Trigonopterus jasminae]